MEPFLYRAFSTVANFRGLPLARIIWIPLRAERLRYGPIEGLVAGFESFSPEELSVARGFLDELLTPTEGVQLRSALREDLGDPVELVEVPLPVTCRDSSGEPLYPLRAQDGPPWKGRATVARRGKLGLPFDVLAIWKEEGNEGGVVDGEP